MNVDKIRNLTDVELTHQQRELSDQLFKMKFQLKMGQTESLKKIREMKKDIARINTVIRQKQIAGGNGAGAPKAAAASAPAPVKKAAKKKAATKAVKKTAATEKK
jgi:large subunit ribosomal protein L29